MAEVSSIAVAGITGKLGQLVTSSILKSSKATVRGFCRNKQKVSSDFTSDSRVTIVEGDSYDVDAVREAVRGTQMVICCYLGPDELMIKGQQVLIDAAVAEGVARIMVSDYTLDYRPLKLNDLPSKDPML